MTAIRSANAPKGTFLRWLEDNRRRHPDKVFIDAIDQTKSITHGEMYVLARRIGGALAARGIGANDRIALLSNNSIEHLAAYIATLAYGATICTINVEMNEAHFEHILASVDAPLVLYEDGLGLERYAGRFGGAWVPLGTWRPGGGEGFYGEVAAAAAWEGTSPVATRDDVASVFYTSGTESTPKGVVGSYAHLHDNVEPVADAFAIGSDDRVLDYRSYNWVSAQVLSALAPLCRGATLLMARQFSASRFFDWIRDHRATIAAGNPTVINMLVNRPVAVTGDDVPHLRFVTSSSAPLLVQDWKNFEQIYRIPICQGYGSSEAIWIAGSNEKARRIGSVGRPFPYHHLAIVDGNGNPLPAGETGAIVANPGNGHDFRYLDEDGSYRVHARGRLDIGDIGYLDADGYLFVTGRTKDLIIRGGVNIAPLEIDNVVSELADVAEAAAVGVPDRIYGEEVVLYVAPKAGGGLTIDDVLDHCRARLSTAKVPKNVVFRDSLPKNDRGKMDRNALAELWKNEDGATTKTEPD
jgi:acyl-CoA synthetase (AMP-forming)/AMP-acid ligase II